MTDPTAADVLARWLETAETDARRLVPAPRGRPVRTSYAQRGFWLAHQIRGAESTAFLARHLYRLEGGLDVAALASALDGLVARHEILRTTFPELDAEPWQVVMEPRSLGLRVEPFPGEAALTEALQPRVDLATGPLFTARLFRVAEDEHLLLVVIHHILNDAWSMDVIHRDLVVLYSTALHGEEAELPPLEFQYADFAEWQHGELERGAADDDVAFWRDHLEGVPELFSLRSSRARPPVQSFAGEWLPFEIEAAHARALGERARAEEATPFEVLLAALAVALARLSGQDDFVVGVPAAYRPLPETEEMVGPFMNILPLRFRLAGADSVGDVVALTRSLLREAAQHLAVPFELLVRGLDVRQDPAYAPIVQVLVSSHEGMLEPLALPGVRVEYLQTMPKDAQRDLTLVLRSEPGGEIGGAVSYSTDVYDERAAQELLAELFAAISAAADAPGTPLGVGARPRQPVVAEPVGEVDAPLEGPVAARVVAAWADVLGRDDLDAGSHFFRLGGTSMSAMRLCARLNEELAVAVPIRTVFEFARLGPFAARVEELQATGGT